MNSRNSRLFIRKASPNLRWEQVDLKRIQIRLNPGETKNKEGRVPPIYGEMRHWLTMQKAIRDTKYPACSLVFHRNGKLIVDFRRAWYSATQRACLSGTVFHVRIPMMMMGDSDLIAMGVPDA